MMRYFALAHRSRQLFGRTILRSGARGDMLAAYLSKRYIDVVSDVRGILDARL